MARRARGATVVIGGLDGTSSDRSSAWNPGGRGLAARREGGRPRGFAAHHLLDGPLELQEIGVLEEVSGRARPQGLQRVLLARVHRQDDDAGLGVLLKTQKRLLASAGKLRLVGLKPHLRDIFTYSGFDQLFEIESAS